MKRVFLVLVFAVPAFAQVDVLNPSMRVSKVEWGLSLGLADFKHHALKDGWYVSANGDYRVRYPVLIGAGLTVSGASGMFMVYSSMRLKVRIPLFSTLKVDPLVSAGIGQVENAVGTKKMVVGGGVGLEVSYFFSPAHTYAGLRFGYNLLRDRRFDHFYVGGVVGF